MISEDGLMHGGTYRLKLQLPYFPHHKVRLIPRSFNELPILELFSYIEHIAL